MLWNLQELSQKECVSTTESEQKDENVPDTMVFIRKRGKLVKDVEKEHL